MKNGFQNWSDVRVFLAVCRKGSTLAASQVLGVAQPTVARRIEALEHVFGLTLFERDNRGFRPTEAARTLLPLAEALEAAAVALADKAHDLSQPRPIRITAFSANFSWRATDIFTAFMGLHPNIQFEFLPEANVLDLMAGEADIALRITAQQPDPELICRHISTARFTLFGAPAYAEKHGLPKSPEEMRRHTFVTSERGSMLNRFRDWMLRYVSPDRFILQFTEVALMYSAVRSGRALGIMNLRMVEEEEKAGALIRCFDPPEELSAQHIMLISPEAYRRSEVREFTKFFAPRYAAIFR